MRFFGFDMVSVGFQAGLVAQDYRFHENREVAYWCVGSCLEEGGWSTRWPHVLRSCAAASFPFDPPEYREHRLITKREQVEAMPPELVALTWGCRRPVWQDDVAYPCGTCRTCRDRRALGLS